MLFVTDSVVLYSKYVTKNALKGFGDFKIGQVIFIHVPTAFVYYGLLIIEA